MISMGPRGYTPAPRLSRTSLCALWLAVAVMVAPGVIRAAETPSALREVLTEHPGVASLLTDYTFSRRVVSTGRVLDRNLHEFLLSHPDIGASLAALQGLGAYRVQRVGPRLFQGTDGEGASAVLHILSEAPGQRIFYARGRQMFRFFPDVSGEALVVLTTRYEEAAGVDLAHGQLTIYARLDNRFLGGLLRLLLPFIGWTLDQKISKAFLRESRSVELLSSARDAILARLEASETLPRRDVALFRALLDQALERRSGPWGPAGRKVQPPVGKAHVPTSPPSSPPGSLSPRPPQTRGPGPRTLPGS